jgi:hypothetical protein
MEVVRDKLKDLTLSQFPGENIDNCCDAQLILLERMDDAGFLKPEHLSLVTKPWKKSKSKEFEAWALRQHEKVAQYRRLRLVTDESAISAMDRVDYEDLIKAARWEYKELVDQNEWSPAAKSISPTEPQLPAAYSAMVANAVQTAVAQALAANDGTTHVPAGTGGASPQPGILKKKGGVSFEGKCRKCGKVGHREADCYQNKKKSQSDDSYWDPPPATLTLQQNAILIVNKGRMLLCAGAPSVRVGGIMTKTAMSNGRSGRRMLEKQSMTLRHR